MHDLEDRLEDMLQSQYVRGYWGRELCGGEEALKHMPVEPLPAQDTGRPIHMFLRQIHA